MYRVVKVNSNELDPSGGILSEIVDLQIPRGFVARIRKVFFNLRWETEQLPEPGAAGVLVERLSKFFMALINDPDDEDHVAIPTHTIDHDVIADWEVAIDLTVFSGTGGGLAYMITPETEIDFTEDLDVLCPRNIRFNAMGDIIGATKKPQAFVKVYFTYEKVGESALLELLNIA